MRQEGSPSRDKKGHKYTAKEDTQKGKGNHLFGGSIGEEGLYMCLHMYMYM